MIDLVATTGVDTWGFGWEAVVGISTGLLALGTAALALSTRKLASETSEDIRASWRPVLVIENENEPVVFRCMEGAPTGALTFRVRNDGRGPALNVRIEVARMTGSPVLTDLGVLHTGQERSISVSGVSSTADPEESGVSDNPSLSCFVALACDDLAERPFLTAAAVIGLWEAQGDQNKEIAIALGVLTTFVRQQEWRPDVPDDWVSALVT
jgi:hypothetical protein